MGALGQAGRRRIRNAAVARRPAASAARGLADDERHRLARDLHDEIGHHLVVLKLHLGTAAAELAAARPSRAQEDLDRASRVLGHAIESLRRVILDHGPAALERVGLARALTLHARQFSARTGVTVRVSDRGLPRRLPGAHAAALYRVVQGALSNVLEHARATRVDVRLGHGPGLAAVVEIEDDGAGFDVRTRRGSFGLAAMRERVGALGGRLRVWSRARTGRRGQGTRVHVELPLRAGARR
jgi:signal transduction histidine kinase